MSDLRDFKKSEPGVSTMHVFFKFILLASAGAFIFIFVVSGAIGYFFYANSSGNPPPGVTPSTFPDWDLMARIPKEPLITGSAILAALWVLLGAPPTNKESEKTDPRKGRKRRYLDED
jgi:hypothetical protein